MKSVTPGSAFVIGCFGLMLACGSSGANDEKAAMDAVRNSKRGGFLQDITLTKSGDGSWKIEGKLKSNNAVVCTGTVKKSEKPDQPWPVDITCPRAEKADPTNGAFAKCESGDADACSELFKLGKTHDETRDDFETALSYFELACSKQHDDACAMACVYHHGEREAVGIAKNLKKAIAPCNHACDANADGGCTTLSLILEKEGKTEEALAVAKKACDEARDGQSCMRAGMITRISSPTRAADPDLALEYHRKGCGHNWSAACMAWGDALRKRGKKGDAKDATRAYSKGCNLGDKQACSMAN